MGRPAIEAREERLGFLPGDLAQKVDPYLRPLYDALFTGSLERKRLKMQELVRFRLRPWPMRGRTLGRARIIIDESRTPR